MKTRIIKSAMLNLIAFIAMYSSIIGQASNNPFAADVKSIDAIINAYYDVISGSAQDPWQFERDRYIHAPGALITRVDENGKVSSHTLEAEYIPLALNPKADFYEVELKRTVNHHGNMAQVWSAFEVRSEPNKDSDIRGLNSIQLVFDQNRWWITSWTTEMESSSNSLVADFIAEK